MAQHFIDRLDPFQASVRQSNFRLRQAGNPEMVKRKIVIGSSHPRDG